MRAQRLACAAGAVTAAILFGLSLGVQAHHETGDTLAVPGYRPDSEHAATFINELDTSTVAVLPTMIHRMDRTGHSFDSQRQIVELLNEAGVEAITRNRRIDLGRMLQASQFQFFEHGLETVSEVVAGYDTGTNYVLAVEMVTPDNQSIFAIQIYIVDSDGQNAFSLLLNEHHQLFAEANLAAEDRSEAARMAMIGRATDAAIKALNEQISLVRDCYALRATIDSTAVPAGVVDDFEAELGYGRDSHGIELGFVAFGDQESTTSIRRTDAHPPRSGEPDGNHALELTANVEYWGGFAHTFSDPAHDAWIWQNWSEMNGLSFWFHGNNSGAQMYVHVFDNRNQCSHWDDAERYGYEFWDDVPGWRLISVPFSKMARADIGNMAPNDGLTLSEVHGWAIGTLNTAGTQTFYVDDFALWTHSPVAASTEVTITHRLFAETQIDEQSSRISFDPRQQRGLAVEKIMDFSCDCARLALERGFSYYRMDDRARTPGGPVSFRMTFYRTPPEGIPVASNDLDPQEMDDPEIITATVDAESFLEACRLMQSQAVRQDER